jgi:hypothetical protein
MEKYKGYEFEIKSDFEPENPREWDNLGTMKRYHSRYNLGDKHKYSVDEAKEILKR